MLVRVWILALAPVLVLSASVASDGTLKPSGNDQSSEIWPVGDDLKQAAGVSPQFEELCTDIDFLPSDLVVMNFGGHQFCCEFCDPSKKNTGQAKMCCPTVSPDGGLVSTRTPLR